MKDIDLLVKRCQDFKNNYYSAENKKRIELYGNLRYQLGKVLHDLGEIAINVNPSDL